MNENNVPKCIVKVFEDYGLDILTLTSYPTCYRDATPLSYTCICGKIIEKKSWKTFVTQKKVFCKTCSPNKKTGKKPPPLEKFIEMLERKGYSLVDPENSGYIDTKTIVLTKDPLGNNYKTSYANFKSNHGSKQMAVVNQKLSIKEVDERLEKVGFSRISGSEYVDNKTPIDIKCHCGNITKVCIGNIREKRVGCEQCYMPNRKYSWDYVEGFIDRTGCKLISLPENYIGRDTIIEVICACDKNIMVKSVKNFLSAPRCLECSSKIRAVTNLEKFGHANFLASETGKKITLNFWLVNFGVTHNMQVEETKNKAKKTCLEHFGVECVFSLEEIRIKARDAHCEKWGDYPGLVPEIIEKQKKTNLERYNSEYPLGSEIIQKKIKASNLKNYGNEVFIQSDAGKALMVERHGVEYAMQCPEIFEKQQHSAFKMKLYIFPSGNRMEYIQGYEWKCLNYLLNELNIQESDIILGAKNVPEVFYYLPNESKRKRYFMDAYILSEKRGIEVKSDWTYTRECNINKAKWVQASLICKGGLDVYVFDEKGFAFRQRIENGFIIEERLDPNYIRRKNRVNILSFPSGII